MSNWINGIPIVSQAKSLGFVILGDVEGARKTQENFIREAPVISQVTSAVQAISGDTEGARKTQEQFGQRMLDTCQQIPAVGFAKGIYHHAAGDHDRGNEFLNSALRTTVVSGAGIAAGLCTGGLGSAVVAVSTGSAYDGVDSLISGEPKGNIGAISNVAKNPNAENIITVVENYVGDAI